MPKKPATPSTATPLAPAQDAVRAQFANLPSLEAVARKMLAEAIAQEYPSLKIDLNRTRLGVPVQQGGWELQPFMPRVLDYLGRGAELNFSPLYGEPYYLSDEPPAWLAPNEGELDMRVIETLVKELTWRLPIGLQDALNGFWGEDSGAGINRWQWLSDVLKDILSIGVLQQPDLTEKAREAINQIINAPEYEDRAWQYGENAVRAYWLKSALVNQDTIHSRLSSSIVLANQDQVLVCRPDGSAHSFKNLDSLSRAWGTQISRLYSVNEIRLKRFELDGHVFDAIAAAILNRQLERIRLLKLPASIGWQALQKVYLDITDTSAFFVHAPQADAHALATLKKHLPEWLSNASAGDQARYRHYSLALSRVKKINQGHTYLHGITNIHTYAADALLEQMRLDQMHFEQDTPVHAIKELLDPNDIELTFLTAAGLPGAAGVVEQLAMSLTHLALKNLLGRPKGTFTVRHRLGLDLPGWLTPDYITRRNGLIERVNIGKVYPQQLEHLLLSDTLAARKREKLFAQQIRVQLALEALELSLKRENGVSAMGARYVSAVMQASADGRKVGETSVVIRRLALVRKPEASPDVVSNMFIIEPNDIELGPHLLYRPLYPQSLIEFGTRTALLDAIAQPSELQDSVLTWLSDIARPIYDHGGFKEPHYVRFGLGSEFDTLETPKPALLATNGTSHELLQYLHNGQLMQFLYGSNARALVEQANAESASNRESRWGVFFEGANLIFNSLLLLPALPAPLMLTGGLLALANLAVQDIPALASPDSAARELAMADVLFNLGMLLFHQALGPQPRRQKLAKGLKAEASRPFAPIRIPELWPEPPTPKIVSGAVALPGEFPNTQSTVLDFSFASARNRLTPSQRERLANFKGVRPDPLPNAQIGGLYNGLYRIEQTWHALIEQDLYPVDVDPGGAAVVVSTSDANHQGPGLKPDSHGHWSWDLRLRLQGGMPPRRIAARQQQNAARVRQLNTDLTDFYPLEKPLNKTIDLIHNALMRATADTRFTLQQIADIREKLDQALQAQLSAYQKLLDTTQERIELQIPLHESAVISLLEKTYDNRVTALSMSVNEQISIRRKWPQFSTPGPELEAAAESDMQGYRQLISELVILNERTIARLEQRNGCLEKLYDLSDAGASAAAKLALSIPGNEYTSLTVKGYQLDCLKVASSRISASSLIESSLDLAIDPLKEHTHTHNELNRLELDASKRLEVLESLVENYAQALDALQGIGIVNADELEMGYFNKLHELLVTLYQDATKQLAAEIKPPPKLPRSQRKPTPSAAGKPQRKVINVRSKGKLIGEVRPAGGEWPIEVIEIRSDYDNQLLTTYSQRGDEWVEIQTIQPTLPTATRDLNVIKGQARKLYSMFEEHLRKAKQYKALSKHPEEVEELLNHEAEKFDKLATELHFALQALPSESLRPVDQTLVDNMRAAAQRLVSEGQALRLELSLKLPPTHGNLHYLLDHQQVQIAALDRRIQLKGERRDFIQEYAVNNREGYPLWYAHFHYAGAQDPKENYTVAHLKTGAQRTQSYFSQLADAQSGQAIVNVHRGQIGKALAERWFLPLVP